MPYPSASLYPQTTGLYPGDGVEVPPTVVTGAASGMTTSQVTLAGSINPNGLQTHYFFQYGDEGSYGNVSPTWNAGTASVNISRTIYGLDSATFYHYRLVGWSAAGTAYGADRTFASDFGPNDYRPSPVHEAGWIQ